MTINQDVTVTSIAALFNSTEQELLQNLSVLRQAYKDANEGTDTTLSDNQLADVFQQFAENDPDADTWAGHIGDYQAELSIEADETAGDETEGAISVVSAQGFRESETKLAAKLNDPKWEAFVDKTNDANEHSKRAVAMAALFIRSTFTKEELASIPVFGSVAHNEKTGERSNNPDVYLAPVGNTKRKATKHRVFDIFDASNKGMWLASQLDLYKNAEDTATLNNGKKLTPKEREADVKLWENRQRVGRNAFRDGLALLRKFERMETELPKLSADIAMDADKQNVRRSLACIKVQLKDNAEFTEYVTVQQFLRIEFAKVASKGGDTEAFMASFGRGSGGNETEGKDGANGVPFPKSIDQALTMMQHLATFFDFEDEQGRKNRAKLLAMAGGKGGDMVVQIIGRTSMTFDEPYTTVERRFMDLEKSTAAKVDGAFKKAS